MGTKERRERQKENLRQEILDAARQMFLKNGYENVSMRQIAAKIEYSPATIYLYFKNKSELFHSLCEEAFAKLEKELEGIVKVDDDPTHRTKHFMGAAADPVGCLRKGRRLTSASVFIIPTTTGCFSRRRTLRTRIRHFSTRDRREKKSFRYLLEIVSSGVEQGKFRKSDPMMLAQTCWSIMHGITSLLITQMGFPWVKREALIHGVIETLVRGVAR